MPRFLVRFKITGTYETTVEAEDAGTAADAVWDEIIAPQNVADILEDWIEDEDVEMVEAEEVA